MTAARHPVAYGLDLAADPPVCRRAASRGAVRAVPWPPDEASLRELERGTAVLAVAAPARCTVVRRLVAPFASERKAARVWASLLDMDLPFPVEAARWDWTPAEPENGKAAALAAAVRRADLDAFLSDAAGRGAAPARCDAEAPALWDAHRREAPCANPGRAVMLVHAAADHVSVLRGRGGRLESVHVVRTAPADLSPGHWLARFRSIAALPEGENGPVDVWWSGAEEGVDSLRGALAGRPGFRHETHRDPGSFLARALASRAVEGRSADLLPSEFLPSAVVRRGRARSRVLHLSAIAAALLAFALNTAVRQRFRAEDARLGTRLAEASSALTDGPSVPGQEVLMAERAIAADAPVWEAVRAARTPDPRAPRAVAILRELAERGARFTRVSWSAAGLDVSGDAPSARAVENLSGWTPNATVQPSPEAGRVVFRLKGEWPDGQ